MKPISFFFSIKGTFKILCLLSMLAFASCSKKITFPQSTVVPAANGYVKIKSTENNYAVRVVLRNLAKAKNLMPPKETYIVWAETNNDGIKKLGDMSSSSKVFSKSLKATLEATLAHEPTKIFITAENDRDVVHPGMQVVLQTPSFDIK